MRAKLLPANENLKKLVTSPVRAATLPFVQCGRNFAEDFDGVLNSPNLAFIDRKVFVLWYPKVVDSSRSCSATHNKVLLCKKHFQFK